MVREACDGLRVCRSLCPQLIKRKVSSRPSDGPTSAGAATGRQKRAVLQQGAEEVGQLAGSVAALSRRQQELEDVVKRVQTANEVMKGGLGRESPPCAWLSCNLCDMCMAW